MDDGGEGDGTDTPTDTTTGTETTTGTSTDEGDSQDIEGELGSVPENLEVTNRKLYEENGEVGLRGTVENTGDTAYGYVEAEATLQDDQGDILYEFIDESEEEDIDSLAPGKSWGFDFVFQEAELSEVTAYTLDIEGALANEPDFFDDIQGEVDNRDPNLEITSHHLVREESTTFVTGTIRNVGDEDVDSVEVSVTLYDDNDNELFDFNDTVEQEADIETLPPGQVWDFRVKFDDIDMKQVARYVVSVDGDVI